MTRSKGKDKAVLNDQGGIALVLTLMVVSFLVAVTVQLIITVDRQMLSAANQQDRVRQQALVLAGLSLAQGAILADQEENEFDSLHDSWADLDTTKLSILGAGINLRVEVTDLSGRLQVNALVQPKKQPGASGSKPPVQGQDIETKLRDLWVRFLTSGRFAIEDQEEAKSLLDALVDWLDEDDDARDKGAENSYYQSQSPPYSCRSGQMLYPEELLLVKGMSPKVVYGDEEHEGIIEYLSFIGREGKVNLNTAPLSLLQVIDSRLSEETVQLLIDFREEDGNRDMLGNEQWYKSVGGFPGDIELDQDLIGIKTSSFKIVVTAGFDKFSRVGTGLLQREENKEQKLLYWKVE